MKRNKLLKRKEIDGLSKEPPSGTFNITSLPLALAGGGAEGTSQEGVTEEDQATETRLAISLGRETLCGYNFVLPPHTQRCFRARWA
jgi:hypothetical protein